MTEAQRPNQKSLEKSLSFAILSLVLEWFGEWEPLSDDEFPEGEHGAQQAAAFDESSSTGGLKEMVCDSFLDCQSQKDVEFC